MPVKDKRKTVIAKFRNAHDKRYDYSKVVYKGSQEKVCIICSKHGEFWQTPANHSFGHGCPRCAQEFTRQVRLLGKPGFIKKAITVHGNEYDYSKVHYTGNKGRVCIVCPKHGEFWQRPNDHLSSQAGCPKCTNLGVSKLETRVAEWAKSLGVKVETQKRLGRKYIDIYLPEHNLGIEINGLYWHSERFTDKAYHQEKSGMAENHGIQLLHFWEHQINNKALIVKSMLRIKLGLAKLRIFARECSIRKIESAQAKVFLDSNHLQGNIASSLQYGLFLDEKLVSVMTLGKPRFNKQYEWEIIRLATLINTVVVGGASKLFSAFCRENSPKSVISYADLDYADGGVYKNLGFTFKGFSNPSYFWTSGSTVLPRYKTQKHKLHDLLGTEFDPNLSERENMQKAGFSRVFNSGNAVFVREKYAECGFFQVV